MTLVIVYVVVEALGDTALILYDNAPNNYDFPAFTGPISPTLSVYEFSGLFQLLPYLLILISSSSSVINSLGTSYFGVI